MDRFEPEAHGMVWVHTVDMLGESGDYNWHDVTIFYREAEQRFYWEDASGCSCYGPLDDVYKPEDLQSGTFGDLVVFLGELSDEVTEDTYLNSLAKAQVVKDIANAMAKAGQA